MHFRHAALAVFTLACGDSGAMAHAIHDDSGTEVQLEPTEPPLELDGPDIPYDRAIQKSIHNAYERAEPLIDQLVYHRVRSIELDIHVRRQGMVAPPRDWFVYHEDNPVMRNTSCSQLSDCLGQLAAFHAAIPRHEVVTLFVDLKESFETGHQPDDLDAALVKALGRSNILTPADMMAACPGAPSLRAAVTGRCTFPTLRMLRGKFIIVTTGGTSCDADSLVAHYGGPTPKKRLAFIGPNVDAACPAESYDGKPDVVFFNLSFGERARAAELRNRKLVTRIYRGGIAGGLDRKADFDEARAAGACHLVTNKASFEQDAWTMTHGVRGFPFACEGCGGELAEPGSVLGLRAMSGDQWGTSDSGFFAYENDPTDSSWSALVSVPSSHVAPFAKACLVARESNAADAANVAVCRTFDAHSPRAQIRSRTGGLTTSISAAAFDGLTDETPAFLRLSVETIDMSSKVTTSVSRDGKFWVPMTTTTLPVALPIRGLSVSSHTRSAKVKGLFTNLVRTKNGGTAIVAAETLEHKAIGQDAAGEAFDGIFAY